MIKTLSIASCVLIPFGMAACGGKQKTPKPALAKPSSQTTVQPVARTTAPATGELREALLHLRRVHFGFDTATLLPEARVALEEAATRLQAYPAVHVYIDGHTDERGTTDYNLALGDRRAQAVSDYLMRFGIDQARLHVVTFGKEQPWVAGGNAVANAKNRRAEFRLMRGDVRLVIEDGVLFDDRGRATATAQ